MHARLLSRNRARALMSTSTHMHELKQLVGGVYYIDGGSHDRVMEVDFSC